MLILILLILLILLIPRDCYCESNPELNVVGVSVFQDYTAKLSDFGLAKDGPEGDNTHVSTRVMGTHGYAAPEYIMTGKHRIVYST